MLGKHVTVKTAEDVCRSYKALSGFKKEKVKSYIMGLMDSTAAAEYEKAREANPDKKPA